MASNFNNNTLLRPTADDHVPAPTSPAPVNPPVTNPAPANPMPDGHAPATSDVPASAAFAPSNELLLKLDANGFLQRAKRA